MFFFLRVSQVHHLRFFLEDRDFDFFLLDFFLLDFFLLDFFFALLPDLLFPLPDFCLGFDFTLSLLEDFFFFFLSLVAFFFDFFFLRLCPD